MCVHLQHSLPNIFVGFILVCTLSFFATESVSTVAISLTDLSYVFQS